jgi:glycosyltransferase involved in cell wall biosynthesis
MSDLPLISIITPTLNSAQTVERTIRHVLDQNYPRLEYIIIDGGSTDGTREIISRYTSRLAYWVSEPDQGISAAFNKGIGHCTGDVIGINNSDDYYEPGVLARVARVFAESRGQFVLHGNLRYYDQSHSRILRPWPLPRLTRYLELPYNHPTYFIPREIYNDVGLYDTSYRIAMDYDWTLRAALKGWRFRYFPEVIAHFAIGGVASSNPRQCHAEVLRCQLHHGLNPLICRLGYAAKMTVNSAKRIIRPATGRTTKGN